MTLRGPGPLFLACAVLSGGACSSSPPAPPPLPASRPSEAPVSDPAAAAARISGDWQFAMERGGRSIEGWLHFSLSAGELVGSLTGPDNNSREISKIAVKGDKITWVIETDYSKETYEGKLAGTSMEGTLKMSRKSGQGRHGGSEGNEGSGGSPGGGYGGHHGGGHGGGGGRGGATGQVTWRAFRSIQPTLAPLPEPTKAPQQG